MQAIGLNAAKAVMPELEGIEDVLEEVKQPEPAESESASKPQPQKLKSFLYWLAVWRFWQRIISLDGH